MENINISAAPIVAEEEIINSINNLTDQEMENTYAISQPDADKHLLYVSDSFSNSAQSGNKKMNGMRRNDVKSETPKLVT
jgi:hypothetical protein